jgi:hypothetical protein
LGYNNVDGFLFALACGAAVLMPLEVRKVSGWLGSVPE